MRLIDADTIVYRIISYNGVKYPRLVALKEDIECMPTIEQKHGHWTKDNRCSRCNNPAPIDNRPIHKEITLLKGIACPYCGAKMDEVTK